MIEISETEQQKKKKQQKSILIVEDEEDHARIIMKGVEKTDAYNTHDLLLFNNGQHVLDYFDKMAQDRLIPNISMIFLDIKLPEKNGFEILHYLRKGNDPYLMPIIILTTTNNKHECKKALTSGANDFIMKPMEYEFFLKKISNIVDYWTTVSQVQSMY